MAFICPECGAALQEGTTAHQMLTCPSCRQTIRVRPRSRRAASGHASQDDALYSFSTDDASLADAATADNLSPEEAPAADPVFCPVCARGNSVDAIACVHCGASLRKKHWPVDEESSTGVVVGRGVIPRRRLTTVLLSLVGVAAVVFTLWLIASLTRGVETPTLAYRRMAALAERGEWGRYYDRLHPQTQATMSRWLQQDPGPAGSDGRALFIAAMKTRPDRLAFLPGKNFTIAREEKLDELNVLLYVNSPGGGQQIIAMMRDQGLWKLNLPELE